VHLPLKLFRLLLELLQDFVVVELAPDLGADLIKAAAKTIDPRQHGTHGTGQLLGPYD
jgi:hypothetical protein